MKKIAFVVLMSLLTVTGYGQVTDHQIILNSKIKLNHSEIDNQYKRFTPTVEEIQQADSISEVYVKRNRNKYPWAAEISDYSGYYRQYVGYYNLYKQKMIFINCFCKAESDWTTNLIQTSGGGSCYFNLKVDLSVGKAFNLNVNARSK